MNNSKNVKRQTITATFSALSLVKLAKLHGFDHIGISHGNLQTHEAYFEHWLKKDFHGQLSYMSRHGKKRSRPKELQPDTLSIISVRMNYLTVDQQTSWQQLNQHNKAYIARYALGRDYHKLFRKRLQKFANQLIQEIGTFGYRVYCDSAPVLEKALAEQAGLGWIGKHTNLIHPKTGSWFFLGEIYTDLPLPENNQPINNHCGRCQRCLDICPTQAIVAPYQLDARRCISYLTIENQGPIPLEYRPLIGNRIFGCDDCLAVCPWNKFAVAAHEATMAPRPGLSMVELGDLLQLDDAAFRNLYAGTPVKRLGRDRFLRNVLIAAGNSGQGALVPLIEALLSDTSPLVRAMAVWALSQLYEGKAMAALADKFADNEVDPGVRAEWSAAIPS